MIDRNQYRRVSATADRQPQPRLRVTHATRNNSPVPVLVADTVGILDTSQPNTNQKEAHHVDH